jgi:hypothetical protein
MPAAVVDGAVCCYTLKLESVAGAKRRAER